MLKKILQRYFPITEGKNYWAIQCPFCKLEGKEKTLYFYSNGHNICYRCRANGRKFTNSWVLLNKLLHTVGGTTEVKIESVYGVTSFIDIGERNVVPLFYRDTKPQYIPGEKSREVQEFLNKREFEIQKVIGYVFYCTEGRLKGRICVPLYPSGYQGRLPFEKNYRILKEGEISPIFSPLPTVPSREIFLVEGPWDSLRLFQFGFDSIALLGVNLSGNSLKLLQKKNPDNVYVWLDDDKVGKENTGKIVKRLLLKDFNVFSVAYKEPGDCLTKEEILYAQKNAVERDVDEYFTDPT